MSREYPRPILQPSDRFDWIIEDNDPAESVRLAQDTAWALLDRIRKQPDPELVRKVVSIADGDGIEDIAELWANTHAHSLAGMLWRLYLIRRLVVGDPEGTAVLFSIGMAHADTIDPVIVGVRDPISPEGLSELCDKILRGAFTGDFAAALERAASASQIFATGAASLADDRDQYDDQHAYDLTRKALRFNEIGRDLVMGARLWRAGTIA